MEEFEVPVFDMDPDAVRILQAEPAPWLVAEILGRGAVRFIAHPDLVRREEYLEKTGLDPEAADWRTYTVTPTSSTRSLLTTGLPNNFVAKTDLDVRHYKYIRRLKSSSVEHSLKVSAEFGRMAAADLLPPEFAYMPESIGVVVGDAEKGAGVIFREPTPRPYVDDARTVVPYFSLYARDLRHPTDPTLLEQLVQENANPGQELDFFIEKIAGLVIRNWSKIVSRTGMLPELHSQNALLEIDGELRPQRVAYRDFQSTYVDLEIRQVEGLDMPFTKHIAGTEEGTDKPRQYSYVYDDSVGHFNMEKLTNSFARLYPQYDLETIDGELQRVFRQHFLYPDFLPSKAYRANVVTDNDITLDPSPHQRLFR